jgi:predicted nucleic acid-binding protein
VDNVLAGSRVYIDTNVIVYFVEAEPNFYDQVRLILDLVQMANAKLFTSEITSTECLHKPRQNNDFALVANYQGFFKNSGMVFLPLNLEDSLQAAKESVKLKLKFHDSIHYLSALEAGCDYFITSDKAFKSGPKMTVIHIKK